MYQPFDIHKFYVLPTQLYLCVLCVSQNKQRLLPYTALPDWFLGDFAKIAKSYYQLRHDRPSFRPSDRMEQIGFQCKDFSGWRTPPTAHSNRFQLFHDSSRQQCGVTVTRCCSYSCFVLLKMGGSDARNM